MKTPSPRRALWLTRFASPFSNLLRAIKMISGFAGLGPQDGAKRNGALPRARFAYRLRVWPVLRETDRTAAIYQALSVMSTRLVSVDWLARRGAMPFAKAQAFIDWLIENNYAEVIAVQPYASAPGQPRGPNMSSSASDLRLGCLGEAPQAQEPMRFEIATPGQQAVFPAERQCSCNVSDGRAL